MYEEISSSPFMSQIHVLDCIKNLETHFIAKFKVRLKLSVDCVVVVWMDWGNNNSSDNVWVVFDKEANRNSPETLLQFSSWLIRREWKLKERLFEWMENHPDMVQR